MAQVITIAGERLFAIKAQNNQPLDIDTFIFANVPGQDSSADIDRNETVPPVGQQVHTQIVQQAGRVNDNVVIYSTVLDSLTGPFDFNWVGLYSSVNQTLVAISHVPNVSKTITVPGAAGNTLNRNFGIEYSGIADLTGITVAPETWQLDYTSRLNGMDELTRQLAADMNGKDWFIGDGFKVVPRSTLNSFKVTAGAGYVSGLRVELAEDHILTLSSYPQFVYVDAWFDGDNNSVWKGQTAFTVTNTEIDDYIDANGKQHYVFKLANITAADVVEDLRNITGLAEKINQHQEYSVKKHDDLYSREFYTLDDAINMSGKIATVIADNAGVVRTVCHHINSSSGGGARYRVVPVSDYVDVPDGVSIAGIPTGADHYCGNNQFVLMLWPENGVFWAEMFGMSVDSTLSNSTTIFNNAFAYLDGKKLMLPEKRLKYSGEVTTDKLAIEGVRPPVKSADNSKLEEGSIIIGSMIIRSMVLYASKFGVDHGIAEFPTAQQNAFVASPVVANSGRSAYVQDIVGLCRDAQDPYHAVLVEGYRRTFANRLYGYRSFFGVVIKTFDSVVGDLIGENNGLYNVIVKADLTQGISKNLTIGKIIGIGSVGVTGVNFELEAIGVQAQQINIESINGNDANHIVRMVADNDVGAIINTVNIGSVTGNNPQQEAIKTTGTGVAIVIDKFNVQNCNHKAAFFEKVNHLVINSFIASAAAGNTYYDNDFVTIGENCGATQISQISLLDQFGLVGEGMINYLNPRGRNKLSMYNAKIKGVGAPKSTVLMLGDTDLTSQIETYKVARANVVANPSAKPLQLRSNNVEDGHVIVVDNSSGTTFDVNNSDGISLATLLNGKELTLINDGSKYVVMARR